MWLVITLTVINYTLFYLWLEKKFKKSFTKKDKNRYESLKSISVNLLDEQRRIKQCVDVSSKVLESTIGLYEVTKDVCRSLDEEQVFNRLKERLKGNVNIDDCLFIKRPKIDLESFKDDFVFEVKIDAKRVGYLIGKGVTAQEDKERFYILAQQFVLGLKRAMLYRRVQALSLTDSLTGLLNRRYFLKRLDEEIARARLFDLKFVILMADIDFFKKFNDRYGHLVGDMVLKEVSSVLKENTRQIDLVGRYGGEEFAILLPETTRSGAYLVAERIREHLEAREIKAYKDTLSATISIGLCTFPDDGETSNELIEKSDFALYEAKNGGRNQVCIFGEKTTDV